MKFKHSETKVSTGQNCSTSRSAQGVDNITDSIFRKIINVKQEIICSRNVSLRNVLSRIAWSHLILARKEERALYILTRSTYLTLLNTQLYLRAGLFLLIYVANDYNMLPVFYFLGPGKKMALLCNFWISLAYFFVHTSILDTITFSIKWNTSR